MYVLCKTFHTQIVQVHLQPFRCILLLKCVTQPEVRLLLLVMMSDQHVCAYLQPFSRYTSQ